MHEKPHTILGLSRLWLPFVSISIAFVGSLQGAPERFSYQGETYQIIEVVGVEGDKATLKAKDGKTVTVPIRFLSSRLKARAEEFAKGQTGETAKPDADNDSAEIAPAIEQALAEGVPPKVWVVGSTVTSEEWLALNSTKSSIELKLDSKGVPLPAPKTRRGAIFIGGVVAIEGVRPRGDNVLVEYFGWDTGKTIDVGGRMVPVITQRKPDPKPLLEEREWTNEDGNALQAELWTVDGEDGLFRKAGGGRFKYPTAKLSAEDQKLITDTVKARIESWSSGFR